MPPPEPAGSMRERARLAPDLEIGAVALKIALVRVRSAQDGGSREKRDERGLDHDGLTAMWAVG